eukprot:gene12366-8492_t
MEALPVSRHPTVPSQRAISFAPMHLGPDSLHQELCNAPTFLREHVFDVGGPYADLFVVLLSTVRTLIDASCRLLDQQHQFSPCATPTISKQAIPPGPSSSAAASSSSSSAAASSSSSLPVAMAVPSSSPSASMAPSADGGASRLRRRERGVASNTATTRSRSRSPPAPATGSAPQAVQATQGHTLRADGGGGGRKGTTALPEGTRADLPSVHHSSTSKWEAAFASPSSTRRTSSSSSRSSAVSSREGGTSTLCRTRHLVSSTPSQCRPSRKMHKNSHLPQQQQQQQAEPRGLRARSPDAAASLASSLREETHQLRHRLDQLQAENTFLLKSVLSTSTADHQAPPPPSLSPARPPFSDTEEKMAALTARLEAVEAHCPTSLPRLLARLPSLGFEMAHASPPPFPSAACTKGGSDSPAGASPPLLGAAAASSYRDRTAPSSTLCVGTVIPGTPAHAQGLRPGDQLLSVNGRRLGGLPLHQPRTKGVVEATSSPALLYVVLDELLREDRAQRLALLQAMAMATPLPLTAADSATRRPHRSPEEADDGVRLQTAPLTAGGGGGVLAWQQTFAHAFHSPFSLLLEVRRPPPGEGTKEVQPPAAGGASWIIRIPIPNPPRCSIANKEKAVAHTH